jgi:predicted RNA-binding protein with PIN domain
MPYLIDGHNLIPHIPGLRLDDLDDELELVRRLQAFCRQQHKTAEVYFDPGPAGNAPAEGARRRKLGPVTVHFARPGATADAAIERRLGQLGGAASNWTVVSSDRQVQAAARAAHSHIMPTGEFARLIAQITPTEGNTAKREGLPPGEVERWLDLFNDETIK